MIFQKIKQIQPWSRHVEDEVVRNPKKLKIEFEEHDKHRKKRWNKINSTKTQSFLAHIVVLTLK